MLKTDPKPYIKFTCYPYECSLGSSPDVMIEHTILSRDLTRNELLEQFECFAKAMGYSFQEGEVFDVVGGDC